ncbi:uncharacterized protein LOC135384179 [Ornithodoros turicata]|uniref:uncharacterized protein LOC135384179 n=1 Tax=Ornithodoros turicata TaxID=34597 RepID=UPI00313A3A92
MPSVCGVRGCMNSGRNAHGYRRHTVPWKEPARTAWLELIGRDEVLPRTEIAVCGLHFRSDDYELNMSLAEASGVGKFKPRLRAGVKPSLNLPGRHAASENVGMAYTCPGVNPESVLCVYTPTTTKWFVPLVSHPATRLENPVTGHGSHGMKCGAGVPSAQEKGMQCSLRKQSKWTQTTVPQTRRAGTQANHNVVPLRTSSTQTGEDF